MSPTSLSLGGGLDLAAAERRARFARRRARLENRALLGAVLALVLLVTLPRLHGIALRENELDALRVIDLLAPRVLAAERADAALPGLGTLLSSDAELRARLSDVEVLDGGRLVRRHGYLFELARLEGSPCLRAWPYEHGRTGLGAFAVVGTGPERALLAHSNAARDGRQPWSGPARAPVPVLAADSTWRRVSVPSTWTECY